MQSLQLRIIIALSFLGALGLAAVIAQILGRRDAPPRVELVAVDVGTLRPLLRGDRPATVEACVAEGVHVREGGRIRRVLARPGQVVRRGAALAEVDDGGISAALAAAQQEAVTAGMAVHSDCRKPPYRESRRDLLAELRRDSIAQTADARLARDGNRDGTACARARRDAAAATSHVSRLRAELGRFTVRAPFDGALTEMALVPGDVIASGQTMRITIARADCRALRARVPAHAHNIRALEPGAAACIHPAQGSGRRRCDATVRSIAAGDGNGAAAEILVEFRPDARDYLAAIGNAARIEIPLAPREHVMRVPVTALLDGDRVLVFDAGSRRLRGRRIDTGIADDGYVEVLAGLHVGERIARKPRALTIDEGARVEPAAGPR